MSTVADSHAARLRTSAGITIRGGDWPAFWGQVCARLRQDGYRPNTLRVYRQVLRDLRVFLRDRQGIAGPGGLTALTAKSFLESLCAKNVSWSWTASVIKTTMRYQACLLPKVASPLDPDPPELALKRLAQTLDRLTTIVAGTPKLAFAQGP